MLEAQDITVRYGPRAVVDRVTLGVEGGKVTVIVGPNGAGKSTLLAALSGAVPPSSGRVMLDGQNLAGFGAHALARRRAVLEQTPSRSIPFPVTELINLAIDRSIPPEMAGELTARALMAFDLLPYANKPVVQLSGGEAHRAHLARTMAQLWVAQLGGMPSYLLIDEPTASLDMAHQQSVLKAARDAATDGAGVLIILHDLTLTAAIADRVVLLQDGRIVADGSVDQVFTPEVLQPVYRTRIATMDIEGQRVITPVFTDPAQAEETSHVRRNEPV